MKTVKFDLLWLTVGFGMLFFFVLGRAALDPKDEGRYAEIPREMLASGDWVTPRLDGVDYFEKPPLVYWIEAASQATLGRSETAARAPVAVFALLGVLLTYAAGRRIFTREVGLASAIILGTSSFYAAYSHILSLDLAVAVLMSGTLFCFLLGIREPPGTARRLLFYGLYATSALAVLTKGLIGVLLTGAVMLLWLIVCGQWKRLRPFYLPTGLLLFFAIALPWHLLAAHRNATWAHFYFIHEQWERFTTTEHGRVGPWYYFIPEIAPGMFPWFCFLIPALRRSLAGGWAARREQSEKWYFVLWAAAIFLFFSKSQSKLPGYILPVFPALAVTLGLWATEIWHESEYNARRRTRWGAVIFGAFCCLLAAAGLVAVYWPERFRIEPAQAAGLRRYAVALAAVLVAGAFAARRCWRRNDGRTLLGVFALTGALMLLVVELATPFLWKPGTKALALEVAAQAAPDAPVFHYHEFFHDFLYYARRPVDIVGYVGELEPENDPSPAAKARFVDDAAFRRTWDGHQRAFAVARKRDVQKLFADPTFHYRLLGATLDHYLFCNHP